MNKLLEILMNHYKEEIQKAHYFYNLYRLYKKEIDKTLWKEHLEAKHALKNVLFEYGYTNEELDTIEMKEV